MHIRQAKLSDLEATLEIYNYEVLNTTSNMDLEPKTIEQWKKWFHEHNKGNHPLYVVDIDGTVAGYVSLSQFRTKDAYKSTVELSIYVSKDFRRQGLASAMMAFVLTEARKNPAIHTIVSVITGGNEASARLHKKFGFSYSGTIKDAGYKFGKYIDINTYMIVVGKK